MKYFESIDLDFIIVQFTTSSLLGLKYGVQITYCTVFPRKLGLIAFCSPKFFTDVFGVKVGYTSLTSGLTSIVVGNIRFIKLL